MVGKDRGVSVLGVGGLRGKGDASQVEPLAPLEKVKKKKSSGFFLVYLTIPLFGKSLALCSAESLLFSCVFKERFHCIRESQISTKALKASWLLLRKF